MKLNDLLRQTKLPCDKCPYKLGLVQTLINPCPQCKENGYAMFERFQKQKLKNQDDLLGAGVTYETAGALQGGRKVWMLARMPHRWTGCLHGVRQEPDGCQQQGSPHHQGQDALTPHRDVW